MKNNLRTITLFAALAFIFVCAADIRAQVPEPIVGGYSNVAATDAQVVSAANFALKAQAKKDKIKIKLVAVNKAAQQVVAGTNYKLCLSVEVTGKKKPAVPQIVEAVVFKNLKQKFELTSWAIAACTDAAPIEPVQ